MGAMPRRAPPRSQSRLPTRPVPKTRLARAMERLAPTAGVHPSVLPGICIYRDDCRQKRYPAIYEPSILIVGQGRKRGHVGGEVFTYDANNYLVLSVPLPA